MYTEKIFQPIALEEQRYAAFVDHEYETINYFWCLRAPHWHILHCLHHKGTVVQ